MNKTVLTVVIVAVIAVVGGGGYLVYKNTKKTNQTSSNSSQQMGNMNDNTSSTGAATPVATDSVDIKDFAFSPANITVKKGTKVTWMNKDGASHTVTSDDDSAVKFDSGSMANGQTFVMTFDKAGQYSYHCNFHPQMTGSITVTE